MDEHDEVPCASCGERWPATTARFCGRPLSGMSAGLLGLEPGQLGLGDLALDGPA